MIFIPCQIRSINNIRKNQSFSSSCNSFFTLLPGATLLVFLLLYFSLFLNFVCSFFRVFLKPTLQTSRPLILWFYTHSVGYLSPSIRILKAMWTLTTPKFLSTSHTFLLKAFSWIQLLTQHIPLMCKIVTSDVIWLKYNSWFLNSQSAPPLGLSSWLAASSYQFLGPRILETPWVPVLSYTPPLIY